jgi:hypothetical protein
MHALAARAKEVGWGVTRSRSVSGAYVLKMTPCGNDRCNHIMQLHLTSSDVNAEKAVEREMNAHGFAGLEKKVAAEKEAARLKKIEADAAAAERKAKANTRQVDLISRAAGPYLVQPEDVDLDWFLTPHPAPWMRWANVTTKIARALTDKYNGRNTDNRPANKRQIRFYRDIIMNGLWHLTHQGIAIDTRAIVQDGQHRMLAQIAASEALGHDVTLPYAVFVGMPVENFKVIDEGMLRNARQLFGQQGEKNATALQTCVRLVHYSMDPDARRAARLKLPNQVVVDTFGADADEYREVTRLGMRDYAKCFTSAGSLAAAMYKIRKVNGTNNEYVGQFYDGLVTGRIPGTRMVLDDDDPRAVFRERMQALRLKGDKRSAMTQMGMIIATWNNCVSDRRVRTLYFNDETTIPAPLRCIPGEGYRPNVFGTLVAVAA